MRIRKKQESVEQKTDTPVTEEQVRTPASEAGNQTVRAHIESQIAARDARVLNNSDTSLAPSARAVRRRGV